MGLHGLLQGYLYLRLQIYEIGYGLDDLGVGVQVPGRVKNVLHIVQTGSAVHTTSYPIGPGGSFPDGNKENVDLYIHSSIRLHGVMLN